MPRCGGLPDERCKKQPVTGWSWHHCPICHRNFCSHHVEGVFVKKCVWDGNDLLNYTETKVKCTCKGIGQRS